MDILFQDKIELCRPQVTDYGLPMQWSLFSLKSRTFELAQKSWADNSVAIVFGIFSAALSALILVQWVPTIILLIIEGCSMVQQTIWPRNHTSHTKVYFNEFVANVLRDDMGSKKIQPPTSKKGPFFQKKKSNWDLDLEISHLRKKVFILTSKM